MRSGRRGEGDQVKAWSARGPVSVKRRCPVSSGPWPSGWMVSHEVRSSGRASAMRGAHSMTTTLVPAARRSQPRASRSSAELRR